MRVSFPGVRQAPNNILVSRERWRPSARLFPFMVRDAIPKFLIPLVEGDGSIEVKIGPLLTAMHHMARCNLVAKYDTHHRVRRWT